MPHHFVLEGNCKAYAQAAKQFYHAPSTPPSLTQFPMRALVNNNRVLSSLERLQIIPGSRIPRKVLWLQVLFFHSAKQIWKPYKISMHCIFWSPIFKCFKCSFKNQYILRSCLTDWLLIKAHNLVKEILRVFMWDPVNVSMVSQFLSACLAIIQRPLLPTLIID